MTTAVVEAPGVAPLNLSEAGSWLCGRHQMLRELVEEIGAWTEGGPDMARVRDALINFDRGHMHTYAIPLRLMSPSQVGRLRLLATLAPGTYEGPGLQFCVDDLATFDRAGKELIDDWLRCIRIGIIG